MKFSAPRGTKDILPEEAARWQWLEAQFREQCRLYGFQEIRTPLFEETELFARSTGEETEIVTKQMYTFTDRGGRSLTLRPEGTPGVVRAYLQSGMADKGGVQRLFYFGPFFRYERPQAGRFRQFHQAGVEVFGTGGPQMDAEVIALLLDFLKSLGIEGAVLKINSTGCKVCREVYREALRKALAPVLDQLCEWCQERYKGNTLRILDEKRPSCRALFGELPSILDYLDEGCKEHFAGLRAQLDLLEIPYEIDSKIVRGLDYYSRTVFEVSQPGIGAQDALGGGGRYDNMMEEFGGKPTPAVGWAAGVDRIMGALFDQKKNKDVEEFLLQIRRHHAYSLSPKVFIVNIGLEARRYILPLLNALHNAQISAIDDPLGRSPKTQMKEAAQRNCRWAVIIGENESRQGIVKLHDMESGSESDINRDNLAQELRKRLAEEKKATTE